ASSAIAGSAVTDEHALRHVENADSSNAAISSSVTGAGRIGALTTAGSLTGGAAGATTVGSDGGGGARTRGVSIIICAFAGTVTTSLMLIAADSASSGRFRVSQASIAGKKMIDAARHVVTPIVSTCPRLCSP